MCFHMLLRSMYHRIHTPLSLALLRCACCIFLQNVSESEADSTSSAEICEAQWFSVLVCTGNLITSQSLFNLTEKFHQVLVFHHFPHRCAASPLLSWGQRPPPLDLESCIECQNDKVWRLLLCLEQPCLSCHWFCLLGKLAMQRVVCFSTNPIILSWLPLVHSANLKVKEPKILS